MIRAIVGLNLNGRVPDTVFCSKNIFDLTNTFGRISRLYLKPNVHRQHQFLGRHTPHMHVVNTAHCRYLANNLVLHCLRIQPLRGTLE